MAEIFEKFLEIPVGTWIALAVIVAFGVALIIAAPKVKWNARMLAYAALSIAISFVLSYLRIYRLPQGGSVTPASMLPILMFAYAYGFGPGLVCSLAYGVLQMFQDMYIVGWMQATLDYIIAYGCLCLVALFRHNDSPIAFPAGVIVAGVCRAACNVLSGVVYFAEYAPEGMSPLLYSLGYNGMSVGVDSLICAVIAFIPGVRSFALKLAQKK